VSLTICALFEQPILGKAVHQGFVLGFGSVATEAIAPAMRKLGLVLNSR
jgi:hypothetical protein